MKNILSKEIYKEKRNNYILNGSYHTLEIKNKEIVPTKDILVSKCIATRINSKGTVATSKINPNKLIFEELAVMFEGSTASGSERAYRRVEWDTMVDKMFAEQVAKYIRACDVDHLPQKQLFAF